MSTEITPHRSQFDPEKAKALQAEAEAWMARRNAPAAKPTMFEQVRAQFVENLPERVEIPYERTPEGERAARFTKAFGEELAQFLEPIDRRRLKNAAAFDRVANWDGKFPGPIAYGPTGSAKTWAAVAAARQLFVKHNRPFTWFPVSRLVDEVQRYEKKDLLDEFYRMLLHYPVLIIDDGDKINWNRQEEVGVLFRFYDWVYRSRRPVITTTNQDRTWWDGKMGPAFVRRMFHDSHFEVKF